MSSNDYLLIKKTKKGYSVSHKDMDSEHILERWNCKTLTEAIIKAREEQGFVEYGVIFGDIE